MATKLEVGNFLRSNFKLEETSPDIYIIEADLEQNRAQLVFVNVVDELIVFTSPFASVNDLTAKQALNAVQNQLFGLREFGEHYCLSHMVFTADLDASEILHSVAFLSQAADNLEKNIVGGDTL